MTSCPVSGLPSTPAPYHDEAFPDYLATSARGIWIGTCAAAIRVDALREAGWFAADHLNAEDSDLWLRLGVAPGFIGVKSPPVFAYRRHAASAISAHAQTARGALHLIAQENRGAYPGGPQRRRERLEILTRHTRPASFACLRAGMSTEGWRIYRETARWNLSLTRWKYLLGFPFIASRP